MKDLLIILSLCPLIFSQNTFLNKLERELQTTSCQNIPNCQACFDGECKQCNDGYKLDINIGNCQERVLEPQVDYTNVLIFGCGVFGFCFIGACCCGYCYCNKQKGVEEERRQQQQQQRRQQQYQVQSQEHQLSPQMEAQLRNLPPNQQQQVRNLLRSRLNMWYNFQQQARPQYQQLQQQPLAQARQQRVNRFRQSMYQINEEVDNMKVSTTIQNVTGIQEQEFLLLQTTKLAKLDLDNECGVCLDEFKDREIRMFPCTNHFIHKDCHELWWEAEKKKSECDKCLCIFRCKKKDIKK